MTPPEPSPARPPRGPIDIAIGAALAVAVLAVFWQITGFGFVEYDDLQYVVSNPVVREGLSWGGLRWALTSTAQYHWHPLTWLSHMLDVELFGLDPGRHHIANLLLHLANTLLLFAILLRATGSRWSSCLVAALFALHPLHVEPVAWIVGRKELLSTLFCLLAMLAYLHHVRRPAWWKLLPVLLLTWLGLMAKSIVITLPVVLLLLDYWPLRRQTTTPLRRLVLEKAVLLSPAALAILFEVHANLVGRLDDPWHWTTSPRLVATALYGYLRYLAQVLWPADLATPYPPQTMPEPWQLATALGVLIAFTAVAIWQRRQRPHLLVGWLWYLVVLAPTSGFLHVGTHRWSDSYTYLSIVGLFIAASWTIPELATRFARARVPLVGATAALLLLCAALSWRQAAIWINAETLMRRALKLDPNNSIALINLGLVVASRGEYPEALALYDRAAAVMPDQVELLLNRGVALARTGQYDAALHDLSAAVAADPGKADVHHGLGIALAGAGDYANAIAEFRLALELAPGSVDARIELAIALARKGDLDAAVPELLTVLRAEPDSLPANGNLAKIYLLQGRLDAAEHHFLRVLRSAPDEARAQAALAEIAARRRSAGGPGPTASAPATAPAP